MINGYIRIPFGKEGGEVGPGLFSRQTLSQARPGDFFVYPSPAPHHVGHISVIVAVDGAKPSQIIHCASSNYQNFNDAIRITAPTVFELNAHSRIMRPDYDALRAVAGINVPLPRARAAARKPSRKKNTPR